MGLFGNKKPESNEMPELDESMTQQDSTITVAVENLKGYADAERVQGMVREGKIVFLRIKSLRDSDINELKRTVDKLKKTIVASDGDILLAEEDVLILCPPNAKVYRG
ncbi:MAG: cell division protein SepF [Candidatus Aenigmarchaeota archaeon]|nr:cell division protein SepF [Candidatus Aenigmarchaeota archaeon]